jgi:hypothetical protein
MFSLVIILVALVMVIMGRGVLSSDANKPHAHRGVLTPYSGKPIPYSITAEQSAKLAKQEPVVVHDVVGKGGRAMVIQDIVSRLPCPRAPVLSLLTAPSSPLSTLHPQAAPPSLVSARITDLKLYPKVSEMMRHGSTTWLLGQQRAPPWHPSDLTKAYSKAVPWTKSQASLYRVCRVHLTHSFPPLRRSAAARTPRVPCVHSLYTALCAPRSSRR